LFYAVFDPRTGSLTYVSAGHMPPLLLRGDGGCERLSDGGISLGMFEQSTYTTGHVVVQAEDLFAVYSDGITEAESQSGVPFDEIGLETALKANQHDRNLSDIGAAVVRAVERHTDSNKFADDLTILLLRRRTTPAAAGV
jgi:serine phosphatase RsbU (regulator of sigma subunit)